MKNNELIKKLQEGDPNAEVGYELQQIAYVHIDEGRKYIDLGWCGQRYPDNELSDTGVFVLTASYREMVATDEGSATTIFGEEVVGLYRKRNDAEKMGEFITTMGEPIDGRSYIKYKIEQFYIH